jgi:pilus assembly protein CpaE
MEFGGRMRSLSAREREQMPANASRIGFVDGAIKPEQISMLASLFPDLAFQSVGSTWPDHHALGFDFLFVTVDAMSSPDMDGAIRRLKAQAESIHIIVILRNADVVNTRVLVHAGAADVLPAPVSEASLALCLERLFAQEIGERGPVRKPGQVVALLKAGGGVGATSLGVQAAITLASNAGQGPRVCFADLDLQFGLAALYFDLTEALSITECVSVGDLLAETQFATTLAAHSSGVRVLAGPRDLTPLDLLTPQLAESLVSGLRRDFALTILDLPSVWTPWTYRALQLADRIVLVTHLSVPHVHLLRRQMSVLLLQRLDQVPLTLVCNAVTADQQSLLSLKTAERSIGRPFDIVVPEDSRVMGAATNEGVRISAIRRGTKLEKAIGLVAEAIAADALADASQTLRA